MSLRFHAYEVTLSGFAGGEYFPLPPSKGLGFPFPSAAPFGLPSAMSNSALRHVDELMSSRSLPKGSGRMELMVEDSGQALLTLEGYPTSPANYAQGHGNPQKVRKLHSKLGFISYRFVVMEAVTERPNHQ